MYQENHHQIEDIALRKILEGTASHTGKEFFYALVKSLAEALGTKGAWVTELLPARQKVRILAFWLEDHYLDEYEFNITGTPCETVFQEKQLYHIPENIIELFPADKMLSSVNAVSYLGAPLLDSNGVILGNLAVLDTRPMPEEARNVALFKIFADRAASELCRLGAENKLRERTAELHKEYNRKSAELEEARSIQLNMLPQEFPPCPNYQFSFSMKTASEVGGDYYDYQMSDDNILTFGIGDATGHGLQASVMVTAIKLLFSEHASKTDIVDFLHNASRSISLMEFQKIYMAFAIGRLKDNILELAGAGMPPAYIYRSQSNTLDQVELKGMPLGSKVEYPYERRKTYINPGDLVILMSDGLPELFNRDGEILGYKRVLEMIMRMGHKTPNEIIEDLQKLSLQWLDGHNQDDDMTFFVFKRNDLPD